MPWHGGYGNSNPGVPIPQQATPGPSYGSTPPSYVPFGGPSLTQHGLDYGQGRPLPEGMTPEGMSFTDGDANPQYGGMYGLSNQIAGQYGKQAEDFWNRKIGNETSGQYRDNDTRDSWQQLNALQMQQAAAMGQVPSAALAGQGMAMNQANAAAARAAASGNPLEAMRAQMYGGQAAARAGAQQRGGEIAQANQGWLGTAGQMRQGWQGAYGLDTARELEQARLNQTSSLGSQGMANQVLLDQLGADTQAYGAKQGYATSAELAAAKRASDLQNQLVGGITKGAADAATAYATSAGKNV